jgi:hypothetical protein
MISGIARRARVMLGPPNFCICFARDRPARAGNALGDGEAAVEQEATDLTNDSGAMIDHSLSRPMQCLDVLLRDRLLRDKRDVRLPCSYYRSPPRRHSFAGVQKVSHIAG